MIIKSYEINKLNLKQHKLILLYGSNEGARKEVIKKIYKEVKYDKILKYDEREILENKDLFYNEILNRSLFDNEKKILINKASDKILEILNYILEIDNTDLSLIIDTGALEKKSKLRNLFEKNKKLICIPFYDDNLETLSKLALNFFNEKKIKISRSDINLLVSKCNGDRGVLKNELNKIELFLLNKKNINTKEIIKLTNLIENHKVSDLIDNCLAKNYKATINILNENLYSSEDSILITRTFLNKSKRILKLSENYQENKNIDHTISDARPPIFWKDKEIIKKQIYNWSPKSIRNLIYKLNNLELVLKKNINNSTNIIRNFILEQISRKTNN